MKWFLVTWMLVNGIGLGYIIYVMYAPRVGSADEQLGAAILSLPIIVSAALWLLTLFVWVIVRA